MAFSIRVRPDVAAEVKAIAAAERRSLNKQIEVMLDDWLQRRREQEQRDDRPPG